MNKKILAGILVILGLMGIGFAYNGMAQPALEQNADCPLNKEEFKVCREYITSDEVSALRDEMHEARQEGDFETVKEIRKQIKEGAPEECQGKLMKGKRMIQNLPDEVKQELKEAFENKDFEAIKAIKEEYFPGHPGKGMRGHEMWN